MELIFRSVCRLCCDFTKVNRKPGTEDYLAAGPEEDERNPIIDSEARKVAEQQAFDEEMKSMKQADEFSSKWLTPGVILDIRHLPKPSAHRNNSSDVFALMDEGTI